jgi:trimethylamine--corrinoid protein Co-methyltransferase
MAFSLKILEDGEIEQISSAAKRILQIKGVRFTIPEIVDVFLKHGFRVSRDSVVHIPPEELNTALSSAPTSFTRKGSHPAKDVQIGIGETKFGIGSIPIWIVERHPVIKRRPATLDDFKKFTLLSEALDSYTIGNPVVQPQEIPIEVMHILWNRNNAVRMTKPACCWYGTSFATAREGLEILRLASGSLHELRKSKRWAITVCPDSALQWGKSAIGAMVMAHAEVPIDVLPMPFLGSMYPVTLAGALVQSTVEALALVVLSQLIRPGCPVLFAPSYGGIMDMSTGSHSFGAPESALFAAAASQIGRSFGLPTNMMQGTTDSKIPDQQAATEKILSYLLPTLTGADCITQAGALLDFALSASYEQLVIEDEIIRWIRRIMRGIDVDDISLAEGEILNLPFGGNYLESELTLRLFRRELLLTRLFDRKTWERWCKDGAKDILTRSNERVEEILAMAGPSQGISERKQRDVDQFSAEICKKNGVDAEPLLY